MRVLTRNEVLDQLREWGYHPENMHASNWDQETYEAIALDSNGKRVWDGMAGIEVERLPWKDQKHYEFLSENFHSLQRYWGDE